MKFKYIIFNKNIYKDVFKTSNNANKMNSCCVIGLIILIQPLHVGNRGLKVLGVDINNPGDEIIGEFTIEPTLEETEKNSYPNP